MKEGFCKSCRNNRCNMCRGYRNGNRSLRCLCTHSKLKPERTPPRETPHLIPGVPMGLDISRLLRIRQLPDRVEFG